MADSSPNQTIPLKQFQKDYIQTLNDFRKDNLFCDVSLDVAGVRFPCHRLILTTASTYFRTMFNGNFKESKSNIVVLEEIKPEVMEQILNAIYTAEIQLTPENAYLTLKASHILQLNTIVDTCVAYIKKNPCIHYLIDTCLFAKMISMQQLHDACIPAIANNLISLSKTDMFEKIPFEILNLILSKGNFARIKDKVLVSIIKWTKSNTCTSTDIQKLLESSKFPSPVVLAELVLKSENTFPNGEPSNGNIEDRILPDFDSKLNLYLNVIDVKTGAAGWCVLTPNDFKFDEHATSITNFHTINSFSAALCRVGTIIYCLETNTYIQKYNFSCYENDKKIEKKISLPFDFDSTYEIEIVAMGSKMLVFSKRPESSIWAYNCEPQGQNPRWTEMFKQLYNYNTYNAFYQCSDFLTAVSYNDVKLYIIGIRYGGKRKILVFNSQSSSSRNFIEFPSPFEYEYASACVFDGKIAISGSDYGGVSRNMFYIFDVNTGQWLPNIKPMNKARANQKLIYSNGFIYAVGNSPLIPNEMYDVNANTWTDLTSLPKQLTVKNSENQIVSINNVFFAETIHQKVDEANIN